MLQTTVHAFCAVFNPTENEEKNRAKALEIRARLAKGLARVQVSLRNLRQSIKLQLTNSVPWSCGDAQSRDDAEFAGGKGSDR